MPIFKATITVFLDAQDVKHARIGLNALSLEKLAMEMEIGEITDQELFDIVTTTEHRANGD